MGEKNHVGGQAVLEGVMMRGKSGIAIAVRTSTGEIVINKQKYISNTKKNAIFSLPIIRGFIVLLESLIIGIKALNYSASFFEEEQNEGTITKCMKNILKDKYENITIIITIIISFFLSLLLFFIVPTFTANFFKYIGINNTFGLNIVEGIIRSCIFLLYIFLIGKTDDINTLFKYHGAEHKSIFCYENQIELTPLNAKKFSRFHPRCGTNFLFLVMIVSIALLSFTGWNSIGSRILNRIMLLPIVSGVTYEIIKYLGTSNSRFCKILSYSGLSLQKLTTKEPSLDQLEVAIAALKSAENIE